MKETIQLVTTNCMKSLQSWFIFNINVVKSEPWIIFTALIEINERIFYYHTSWSRGLGQFTWLGIYTRIELFFWVSLLNVIQVRISFFYVWIDWIVFRVLFAKILKFLDERFWSVRICFFASGENPGGLISVKNKGGGPTVWWKCWHPYTHGVYT